MAEDDSDLEVKAQGWRDYFRENKKARDILVWVWHSFLGSAGRRIALKILVLMTLANLLLVLGTYALRMILDGLLAVIPSGSRVPDASLLIIGFVCYCLILVSVRKLSYEKNVLRERFFGDFSDKLNNRVSELFFQKSLGMHVSENNVLNESNVKKGYDRVFDLVYVVMFEGIETVLTLLFAYLILWPVNSIVALIMTAMVLFHLFLSGTMNYKIMVDGYPIEKKWRFLHRYRVERWQHIERVKNNAKEVEELEVMDGYFQDAIKPDLRLWTDISKRSYGRGLVSIGIFILAMIYGVREIISGDLSLGWFYPLFSLSSQIMDNLWKIGDLERKIHYNLHSVGILKEALDLPVGISFSEKPVILPKDSLCGIEFDSVGYRFGDNEKSPQVLSNISFRIEPQEKVALIGTSGAGKTTLMKLLLRYMDPTSGSIRIDGCDLRDVALDSWLNLVGYVPQQAQVLNGTIRYNALYGLPMEEMAKISDEYIWEQMRLLQVDFGDRLTEGLETKIGYNGIKLSGGQNQRLMILAAAMKSPKFMVVDEATSSLDSSTEKLVQAGLEKVLSRDCGALIIAHRLSTVRRICNKFIVLEPVNGSGGNIVGVGRSFEELYDGCPQFRKLAHDQDIVV